MRLDEPRPTAQQRLLSCRRACRGRRASAIMAAAYHWEARRRQLLVEKRLRLMQARAVPEGMADPDVPKEVPPSELPQNPPPPPPGIKEDACPCHTDHVMKHSGKLLKRYTTTEYIQQW
ncbi:uncharacterized protein LOC144583610 [Pogona vitticeps]